MTGDEAKLNQTHTHTHYNHYIMEIQREVRDLYINFATNHKGINFACGKTQKGAREEGQPRAALEL